MYCINTSDINITIVYCTYSRSLTNAHNSARIHHIRVYIYILPISKSILEVLPLPKPVLGIPKSKPIYVFRTQGEIFRKKF
jgi:hypothetical protein